MTKWEYCSIYPVYYDREQGWLVPGLLGIKGYKGTFMISGATREKLENPNALAQKITQLGQEGWEMSGCGTVSRNQHVIYFKRPIEE